MNGTQSPLFDWPGEGRLIAAAMENAGYQPQTLGPACGVSPYQTRRVLKGAVIAPADAYLPLKRFQLTGDARPLDIMWGLVLGKVYHRLAMDESLRLSSEASGISTATLSRFQAFKHSPSSEIYVRLCAWLDLHPFEYTDRWRDDLPDFVRDRHAACFTANGACNGLKSQRKGRAA